MDSSTGEIRHFKDRFEAEAAGFDTEVPAEDYERVHAMTRKDRRAWAAKQRANKKPGQNRHRSK